MTLLSNLHLYLRQSGMLPESLTASHTAQRLDETLRLLIWQKGMKAEGDKQQSTKSLTAGEATRDSKTGWQQEAVVVMLILIYLWARNRLVPGAAALWGEGKSKFSLSSVHCPSLSQIGRKLTEIWPFKVCCFYHQTFPFIPTSLVIQQGTLLFPPTNFVTFYNKLFLFSYLKYVY